MSDESLPPENDDFVFSSVDVLLFAVSTTTIVLFLIAWIISELSYFGLAKVFDTTKFIPQIAQTIVQIDYVSMVNVNLPAMFQITPEFISRAMFSSLISFIIFGFTLPLRSVFWTLWYKKLVSKLDKSGAKSKNKKSKGKKQLDPEILRRANLKDDEEV